MSMFIVRGLLVGTYLPAQPLIFDTVAIVLDPEIDKLSQKRPQVPTIEGHTEGVVVRPAIDVRSRWRIDLLLEASCGREALEHARKSPVPLILAAFGTSTGEKYTIDLVQAIELEDSPTTISSAVGSKARGQVGGDESKLMTARVIVAEPLLEDIAEAVRSRFHILATDAVEMEAASRFSNANELTDLTYLTDAVAPAVLTSCHLCIDSIVKEVAPTATGLEENAKKQTQTAIAEALKASLNNSRLSLSKRIARVQESGRSLKNLDQTNAKSQTRVTCNRLGLDVPTAQEACDFLDFRNRYLAHSGNYPGRTELHNWFGQDRRAQKLAGVFLKAFLDYRAVSGKSLATSP